MPLILDHARIALIATWWVLNWSSGTVMHTASELRNLACLRRTTMSADLLDELLQDYVFWRTWIPLGLAIIAARLTVLAYRKDRHTPVHVMLIAYLGLELYPLTFPAVVWHRGMTCQTSLSMLEWWRWGHAIFFFLNIFIR
jgi:hypothetical protein